MEGIHLINKAVEKNHEEKMFKLYSSAYPHFSSENFKTFEEFYKPPKFNEPEKNQTVDEILSDVKEVLRLNKERRK